MEAPETSARRKQGATELPDLSRSYMDTDIPAKQRALVDRQLQEMYRGEVPGHFLALANAFQEIITSCDDADKPLTLLDAGCASGYYWEVLDYLLPHALSYWGTDFSQAMLGLACERYPDLRLARMDIRKLAWKAKSFDVVLSGAVIVHVREWGEAVAELARVTRKWLVLHRTLVCIDRPTFTRLEQHYDVNVYRVFVQERELITLLDDLGYQLKSQLDCHEGSLGPDIAKYTYLFMRRPAAVHG
jgi:SAM-dependent methyltransferase